jgi:hypothetical protein
MSQNTTSREEVLFIDATGYGFMIFIIITL